MFENLITAVSHGTFLTHTHMHACVDIIAIGVVGDGDGDDVGWCP